MWSLAKVLWKLATQQHYPIEGTFRKDVSGLRLSTYALDDRAKELDTVLEAATQFEPSDRITMQEFYSELDSWLQSHPAPMQQQTDSLVDMKLRISGMFTIAKRERAKRKATADTVAQYAPKGRNLVAMFADLCLNDIDAQIVETGLCDKVSIKDNLQGTYEVFKEVGFPQ